MIKTVVGSFDSISEAASAARDLRAAGFIDNDVSVIANNQQRPADPTIETTRARRGQRRRDRHRGGRRPGRCGGIGREPHRPRDPGYRTDSRGRTDRCSAWQARAPAQSPAG